VALTLTDVIPLHHGTDQGPKQKILCLNGIYQTIPTQFGWETDLLPED
jgi:hypothetical protein